MPLSKQILVRKWLFVLMGLLVLLLSLIYWGMNFWALHHLHTQQTIQMAKIAQRQWQGFLEAEIEVMRVQLDHLAIDPTLQKLWSAKQENLMALERYTVPIAQQLRARNQITHFYLMDLDRTVIFRPYDPKRVGGVNQRTTMLRAQQSGQESCGMDIGSLGTFTLRCVRPWKIEGRLVGHLELGMELEHLTRPFAQQLGLEVVTLVKKSFTTPEKFDKGKRQFGFMGQWEQFPHFVVLNSTLQPLPLGIAEIIHSHEPGSQKHNSIFEIEHNQTCYQIKALHVPDVDGNVVAELLLLKNMTKGDRDLQTLLRHWLLALLGVMVLMVPLLWWFATKVERYIQLLVKKLIEREEQRAQLQAQVHHADKLASIGTLAAGVAHEINNPLAIAEGFVELLKRRWATLTEEERTFYFTNTGDAFRRIAAIVEGLKSYARPNNETLSLVSVHRTVETTLALLQGILQQSQVEVTLELNSPCDRVMANEGKLQQVLTNLLLNARDAFEESVGTRTGAAHVRIATRTEQDGMGERLLLEVSDNGPGIVADHLKSIFDPFFTTKPPGKGTGLGLAISQTLLASMEATISVQSWPGKGTTFTLTFGPPQS